MKNLYTSLVRAILEYVNVVWAPTLKRDQQMIENIQRRTTKQVPELKNLEYGDRLRALKLPSLYYIRARGDMIETYKYIHGIYQVDRMPNGTQEGKRNCRTTKELLQAHGSESLEHPHRVCSFGTLIKYF